MATRGSMPKAAAVSALQAAIEARSWLLGLTLTAQSPYTSTCRAPSAAPVSMACSKADQKQGFTQWFYRHDNQT